MTSGFYFYFELFVRPLFAIKRQLTILIVSLVMIGAAQGLFILAVGPFLKALLGLGIQDFAITGGQIFSPTLVHWFPILENISLGRDALLVFVPLLLLGSGLVKNLATYLFEISSSFISLYSGKIYRDQLFQRILQQTYSELRLRSPAEWMSALMNDVIFLQTRLADILNSFLRESVTILAAIVTLLFVHWPTAMCVLLVAPLIALRVGKTGRRITRYAEAFQRELALLSDFLLDVRKRFNFVRAQQAERFELDRFSTLNHGYYRAIRASILVRSAFAPILEFFGFLTFAAIFFVVTHQYVTLAPEMVVMFFATVGILLRPLKNLGEQLGRFHETTGALRSGMNLLQQAPHVDMELAQSPPFSGTLNLEQVICGIGNREILQAGGVCVTPGMCIVIVGPSGGGKSTLMRTLAGLLRPLAWESSQTWMSVVTNTSFVSQEPFLFDGTVRENLLYGMKSQSVPDTLVEAALAKVNMQDEVRRFSAGIDTNMRAFAGIISGGQQQRLVIARALLREKQILLLDEATSALDEANEMAVMTALIRECKTSHISLVAITHRFALLERFDEVWFIEGGKMVNRGKHQDLLKDERYREFYNAAK